MEHSAVRINLHVLVMNLADKFALASGGRNIRALTGTYDTARRPHLLQIPPEACAREATTHDANAQ